MNKKKTNLYVGNAVTKPEKLKVVRNHLRWAVSVEQYKEDSYPPYASGIGYILSRDVAQKLVAYSQYVHPFPNEDAFVGVVLSQAEVKVTSSARFSVSSSGLSVSNLLILLDNNLAEWVSFILFIHTKMFLLKYANLQQNLSDSVVYEWKI